MKAIIIIAACLILAVALRILEVITSRKPINSVGAKSNAHSKNIPTIDISDEKSIKAGLEHYRDLED